MAGKKKGALGAVPVPTDSTTELPFETSELRKLLEQFLNRLVENPLDGQQVKVGNFQWGIYSFYVTKFGAYFCECEMLFLVKLFVMYDKIEIMKCN